MSNRPVRHTGVLARDQILAWQLQLQSHRNGHCIPSGSKALRATKAASAGKPNAASVKCEQEKKSSLETQTPDYPPKAVHQDREEAQSRLRNRFRARMAREARIQRTLAIASTGLGPHDDAQQRKSPMHITLCPADDWHKSTSSKSLGPLQNSNLSTSAEATIAHLKQFLVSRLAPTLLASEILIACRGLVLRDDQLVWWVKKYIWPSTHPLPPVLRYRLRSGTGSGGGGGVDGKPERPSSLAHTGEIVQDYSLPDPNMKLARVGGEGGQPRSWVEQYPSDFIYNQHFVRTGAHGLPPPPRKDGAGLGKAGRAKVSTNPA